MLRNLLDRFAGAAAVVGAESDQSDMMAAVRERVASGIDPLYVGDLVREGIGGDWPYIFTDAELEAYVDARFANIKAGFDRIREREPRR